jgi:hypothetical protein
MEKNLLVKKIDNLLEDLSAYVESQALSENEVYLLKTEIDKLLYECLYYKSRLIS